MQGVPQRRSSPVASRRTSAKRGSDASTESKANSMFRKSSLGEAQKRSPTEVSSPKGGGPKARVLSLDLKNPGLGSSSPKSGKALDPPRKGSPRGKALETTDSSVASRSSSKGLESPTCSTDAMEQAGAMLALRERFATLQAEHASLQHAHGALQAKHRESVGSCLLLLEQVKQPPEPRPSP